MARHIHRASAGVAGALLAVTLAPASPAVAQSERQLDWCLNKNEAFSPRLRIDGCTAAIESNQHTGKFLYSLYYNRGIAHFKIRQYDRAIADFDEALRLNPTSTYAFNNRGMAYARTNQYDRAIDDFDQAIALDPNHTITYNNRGSAYARKGQFDLAIADFDRALQLDPRDSNARKNRRLAERMRGNVARADGNIAAPRNRSLPEQAPATPPAVEANDARARATPTPPYRFKGNAAARERIVASEPDSRGSGAIRSKRKVQVYAARPRRSKPQSALARFFRQQQFNVRKFFRTVSGR